MSDRVDNGLQAEKQPFFDGIGLKAFFRRPGHREGPSTARQKAETVLWFAIRAATVVAVALFCVNNIVMPEKSGLLSDAFTICLCLILVAAIINAFVTDEPKKVLWTAVGCCVIAWFLWTVVAF